MTSNGTARLRTEMEDFKISCERRLNRIESQIERLTNVLQKNNQPNLTKTQVYTNYSYVNDENKSSSSSSSKPQQSSSISVNNVDLDSIPVESVPREESKASLQNRKVSDVERSKSIARDYAESFSIHGLSRVVTGKVRKEKVFWFFALAAALGIVSYAVYGFITEYTAFNIRTDIRVVQSSKIQLPDIIVCNFEKYVASKNGKYNKISGLHCKDGIFMHDESIKCNLKGGFEIFWS